MSTFQTLAPLLVSQTLAPVCPTPDFTGWGSSVAFPLCCCVPCALVALFWLNVIKAQQTINWSVAACVLGCVAVLAWLLTPSGQQAWRDTQCWDQRIAAMQADG